MHQILSWLVQNTLTVALLLPLVLLLARLWRFRPANQHLLWLLLLVKLLTPPLVCWPVSIEMPPASSPFAGMPIGTAAYEAAASEPRQLIEPTEFAAPLVDSPSAALSTGQPAAAITFAATPRAVDLPNLLPQVLVGIWLAGAAAVGAWIVRQLLQQARILRRCQEPTKTLQQWVNDSAQALQLSHVRLRVSDDVTSPFVSCLGWPTLIWPAPLAKAHELACYQAVLAHELAHLARRDHWVTWLELAAMPLWWFNPLLWYLRSRLDETRELACDALALETAGIDRRGFAELLLALSTPDRLPFSPAAPLQAGIGSAFHRRLAMLFCDRTSGRISLAGLLVTAIFAAAALPGWAQAPADPKPQEVRPAQPAATTDAAAASTSSAKTADDPVEPSQDPDASRPSDAARTFGSVLEIKDDILLIQLAEGASLPTNSPVFVIRITPTHSEMIGQLRILKSDGKEVAAKLQPQVAKPQVGDKLWSTGRSAGANTYRRNVAGTTAQPAAEPVPSPPDPPPATTEYRPSWVRVTSALNEGALTFQLEDGSRIVAHLDASGTLRMFLEKDGKRQELARSRESARTASRAATGTSSSTSPHSLPSRGTSGGASTRPAPMTAVSPPPTAARPAPPSDLAVLGTNLELAKLEVEEKEILLNQAQELEKQKSISPLEVRLKEVELRKAKVRLKQAQLQMDATRSRPQPGDGPQGR